MSSHTHRPHSGQGGRNGNISDFDRAPAWPHDSENVTAFATFEHVSDIAARLVRAVEAARLGGGL